LESVASLKRLAMRTMLLRVSFIDEKDGFEGKTRAYSCFLTKKTVRLLC